MCTFIIEPIPVNCIGKPALVAISFNCALRPSPRAVSAVAASGVNSRDRPATPADIDFGTRVGTEAAQLDTGLILKIEKAARDLGLAILNMPTVGHDAALFARAGVPAGMVLIRNQNGNHKVNEAMEIRDFLDGVKVLARCALEPV
ncbi:M20/M25/M40 family metallo-hydrolase [Variovorax sp. OV700]|uniref:M20/M25/M40 family metallo-hydrolase n=1 Tax=Variovorax sp. OV700 TaxID=1882826 RepID=UPI0020C878D8|nr:M20/M25/M40 family metallo-hydrolase [Variovorax sp. OV700]